jgi:anaerobic selenocysteine-containing dehydrogenase
MARRNPAQRPESGGSARRPAFDRFAERCAAVPPERVARLTGVDPGQRVALAEAIGGAGVVAHCAWTGIGQHANSPETFRAWRRSMP